jgi:hypothetical protein
VKWPFGLDILFDAISPPSPPPSPSGRGSWSTLSQRKRSPVAKRRGAVPQRSGGAQSRSEAEGRGG